MDIGINYLNETPKTDAVYKTLIENGYINTLKFPGKNCTNEELEKFEEITEEFKIKKDIHGLPEIVPAINSPRYCQNVSWENVKQYFNNVSRMSTHVGLENNDRLANYSKEELDKIFEKNIATLKEKLNIKEMGVENIPGGFNFDVETLKPTYINDKWDKADFGVFDITHAKLAAEVLNIGYERYLDELDKSRVKILHVAGNIDKTGKFRQKPDRHILTDEKEISYIIEAIKEFKNLDLVVSEYGFNSQYSYEKEIIIEVVTLWTIVHTMNENRVIEQMRFLKKNLKDDVSNMNEMFEILAN